MSRQPAKNDRAIELIKQGAESMGVRCFARAVGISPAIVTRYTQDKCGETSYAILQKLSNYFNETFVIEVKPE